MRTLTLHTADELVERWKRRAFELDHPSHPDRTAAQAYRVCAAELMAIVAVSMELEAAHHGDPEQEETALANALFEWSQGRRA